MDALVIEPGTPSDIDELERLYDDLNDYLSCGINYPGWIKGVYPVREIAQAGVAEGSLFVARQGGRIAGSVILSHEPAPAYHTVNWQIEADYADVIIIRTLVIHPACLRAGIGTKIFEFIDAYSMSRQMKSMRLDVFEKNLPAIRLYEKRGFAYVDTVDLGLGQYGLDHFRLYERLVSS
jgi:GNAT superfamily N-acetyltransferase